MGELRRADMGKVSCLTTEHNGKGHETRHGKITNIHRGIGLCSNIVKAGGG